MRIPVQAAPVLLSDPVERRQAPLLRVILMLMSAFGAVSMVGVFIGPANTPSQWLAPFLASTLMLISPLGGLWLLRRGAFQMAVYVTTSGFVLAHSAALFSIGVQNSELLPIYMIPLTLVGLIASRRALIAIATLICVCVVLLALSQTQALFGLEREVLPFDIALGTAALFSIIVGTVTLFFDRFGNVLRDALTTASAREQELARLSASLETAVAERTAELQHALSEGELREARLAQTLDALQTSQLAVRELSAPVLPVLAGVLVAPMIGVLDHDRVATFTEQLLHHVERQRTRSVIIDITGALLLDTASAQGLLATASAIKLLGAQVLLVGVRPEIAQTLVSLGVEFSALKTYSTLQEAVSLLRPA